MLIIKRKKIRCPECNKKMNNNNAVCPNCNYRLIFPKLKGINGLISDCYFPDKDPA